MPIGTLLLGLALLVVVGFIIVLPMFDRRKPAIQPPSQRDALEAERQDIVRTIRELDFDHRTHKINDDDYKRLREAQVQRGAQVLRELSALTEHGADDAIERRVAELRKVNDAADALTCPSCGRAVSLADKFCPQCGHKLVAAPFTGAQA